MESIMKSEIFFFITSISVVVFTIFIIIIGFYIVKIVRNFAHISETLKEAVDDTNSELREMTGHIRESAIFNFIFGKKKKRTKK